MAHLDKYTRKDLRKVLRETYREYEDPTRYENDVNPALTHLNYSARGYKSSYEFMRAFDDRVADIIDTRMDGQPPKQEPKFGSWVITCPEELRGDPEMERKFFDAFFHFVDERYEGGCVDMVVHNDETHPHCTAYVIPLCRSRKTGKWTISAATVFQRSELQTFHRDFNSICEKIFGIPNLVVRSDEEKGNDRRDKTLTEYKQERQTNQDLNDAAAEAYAEIAAAAADEAQEILLKAKAEAARITKDADEYRESVRFYESEHLKEAKAKLRFAAEQLDELKIAAARIKEEVTGGFGCIEDAMVLSMVEEAGQRDELVMQYKRRHPSQLGQDTARVKAAKEATASQTRRLPDIRGITAIKPVSAGGMVVTSAEYDRFLADQDNEMEEQ